MQSGFYGKRAVGIFLLIVGLVWPAQTWAKPEYETRQLELNQRLTPLSTANLTLTGRERPQILKLKPYTPAISTQNVLNLDQKAVVYLPPATDTVHLKPKTYTSEKFGKEMKQHYIKNFLIYSAFLAVIAFQELSN